MGYVLLAILLAVVIRIIRANKRSKTIVPSHISSTSQDTPAKPPIPSDEYQVRVLAGVVLPTLVIGFATWLAIGIKFGHGGEGAAAIGIFATFVILPFWLLASALTLGVAQWSLLKDRDLRPSKMWLRAAIVTTVMIAVPLLYLS